MRASSRPCRSQVGAAPGDVFPSGTMARMDSGVASWPVSLMAFPDREGSRCATSLLMPS